MEINSLVIIVKGEIVELVRDTTAQQQGSPFLIGHKALRR